MFPPKRLEVGFDGATSRTKIVQPSHSAVDVEGGSDEEATFEEVVEVLLLLSESLLER